MNGSDPRVDEVIHRARWLEERYAALIELFRAERLLLVHPTSEALTASSDRQTAVLEQIAEGEARLRDAAGDFTRRGDRAGTPDPTLLDIAARLPDLLDRERMTAALVRLRHTVRAARALSEAHGRFVDRGLANLRHSLERMARETGTEAGYQNPARLTTASSGAVVQELA
ncbi:MAG: flagellar export chaperone FlgN [Deltaproteobacteria bacterium]|jgi:hypothetical protein|nr:flagellar export chaperone FlgN [Deltaproteobacteria bacterium]